MEILRLLSVNTLGAYIYYMLHLLHYSGIHGSFPDVKEVF